MDKYLGKRLDGRYEMRELIGVGGMAYVYKAYDAVDDRIVAVKILKDEFLNSDEFVRRFRNESKAIAILSHPNIVKVLDVGFGDRLQYIVMEYIDGITLKEYLDQRKDIRWKEAVHFTVQILRALQHAHDKGIVHRDIKPQNIMLLSDGTIKVTDFGIARLTRSDLKATVDGNKAIGSVHYISPEQARGEITDEKTDLYAVGIMLYEMLTGCLPFEADNAVSVAIMQMQSEAKAPHLINAEIPEGLEQITLKAMQKDTAKRYQSAAEMLNDFEEFKKNPSIKFEYTYMVDETPTRYVDAITRVRGESPEPAAKVKKENSAKKKKSAPKNEDTKKTVTLIVSLSLIALLVGTLIFCIIKLPTWFPTLFGEKPKDEVTVDRFIGMMYHEVENNIAYAQKFDLKFKWEDAHDPDVKKGEIFRQDPAAGKSVLRNATITLYVNNATPKDIQLDVRVTAEGMHKNDVRKLLVDAGFGVKEIVNSSATVPADHVISINIIPGQAYAYGTEVTMTVSSGPSKLPPIEFPTMVIGENETTAEAILRSHGFKGQVTFAYVNYIDEQFATKGTVMGIAANGVLEGTLPPQIDADGMLTLAVSNGFKNVTVELDWPQNLNGENIKELWDVRVIVGNKLDSDFGSKYVAYQPLSTDKIVFDLLKHPEMNAVDNAYNYNFEVQIKKHDAPNMEYTTHVTLRINPVEGTWTIVGDYQPLPGIHPTVAVPDLLNQRLSYDAILNQLKHFNVTVLDGADAVVTGGDNLLIEQVKHGGTDVTAGTQLTMHSAITVKVSAVSTDVVIPDDIFDKKVSLAELNSMLNGLVVTVKDSQGHIVTMADEMNVLQIVSNGSDMDAGDLLPTGSVVEVLVTDIKIKVPEDLIEQNRDTVVAKLTELGFAVDIGGANGTNPQNGEVLLITCNGENASGKLWEKGATLLITVKDPA